jgi:hypothetical protein
VINSEIDRTHSTTMAWVQRGLHVRYYLDGLIALHHLGVRGPLFWMPQTSCDDGYNNSNLKVSTMKNYISPILICGFTLISSTACSHRAAIQAPAAVGPSARLPAIVATDLKACADRMPVVAQADAKVFSQDRIEKTLNGIWRGKVWGDYPKGFLKDGLLNVDYYMIIDVKRGEALVFEQFGDKRSVPEPKAGAPLWSWLMCGKENYTPPHPPQVHEFQKVSDNLADARSLLRTSTGMSIADTAELVLSDTWQRLVDTKYFDHVRSRAYAGALFKPFDIGNATTEGTSLFSMKYQAEYRGGGITAARFQRGVPIRGVEQGQFVGVSTGPGDFLLSSAGNGVGAGGAVAAAGSPVGFSKVASQGGAINMTFDKVVIGPLSQ